MTERACRVALGVVLALYAVLGTCYAINTPAWQAPDEPAHFNYIRYVAENGRLPILQVGDFPAEYLEEIKAQGFPADMPVDAIRYESHQPPLYYVLAAGVYRLLTALGLPLLLGLRLFSVLLGLTSLAVGYHALVKALPQAPLIALGATAFAATVPMHVAMTAAVNNDALVELMVALIALLVMKPRSEAWSLRRSAGLGVLAGLAMLTKMQALVGVGLTLLALYRDATDGSWQPRRFQTALLPGLGTMCATALVTISPWLIRNMRIYGLADPLGLARHDVVVQGQLTTAQAIAEQGLGQVVMSFVRTTFRSFWGQFGWMGVLLDERIYMALAILCALVAIGFLIHLLRPREGVWISGENAPLLALWLAIPLVGYLWWNVEYVQHQGRYLFPAILPIGVIFTIGLEEVLALRPRISLAFVGVPMLALAAYGLALGDLPGWWIGLLGVAGMGLWLGHLLHSRHRGAALAVVYLGMAGLALFALFEYVVPALT